MRMAIWAKASVKDVDVRQTWVTVALEVTAININGLYSKCVRAHSF